MFMPQGSEFIDQHRCCRRAGMNEDEEVTRGRFILDSGVFTELVLKHSRKEAAGTRSHTLHLLLRDAMTPLHTHILIERREARLLSFVFKGTDEVTAAVEVAALKENLNNDIMNPNEVLNSDDSSPCTGEVMGSRYREEEEEEEEEEQ
ncbi:hypothetical protein INR49_020524, partial [Caranx melampygus]